MDLRNVRLTDDQVKRIESYAEEQTGGNFSEAVRTLVALGLERDHISNIVSSVLKRSLSSIEERVARSSSRGTKASLASLVLLSQMNAGAESFDWAWKASGKIIKPGSTPDYYVATRDSLPHGNIDETGMEW